MHTRVRPDEPARPAAVLRASPTVHRPSAHGQRCLGPPSVVLSETRCTDNTQGNCPGTSDVLECLVEGPPSPLCALCVLCALASASQSKSNPPAPLSPFPLAPDPHSPLPPVHALCMPQRPPVAWPADMQCHQGRHRAPPRRLVSLTIGLQTQIPIPLPPPSLQTPRPPPPPPEHSAPLMCNILVIQNLLNPVSPLPHWMEW